ncbi:hypothetical protein YTPLAS18_08100 [Nitrospira sp.]|nr:hypothetical protein YTPLAS18_08100 [Nitrospira sp.]
MLRLLARTGLVLAGVLIQTVSNAEQVGQATSRHTETVISVARTVPSLGDPAPDFRLKNLSGETITLDHYRGVVIMVNFWATWCGPCRVEMPAMEELYRTFLRKDFEILAVSTDAQGMAVTRPFTKEFGLTFPVLHDADYQVGLAYGARTLPMTFLLDRQGVVRHRVYGARDWHSPAAVQLIQTLIKEGQS